MSPVALTLVTIVLAHELPPGVTERAIQVTAYPERIEVLYQFGLNEVTMREQIEQAGQVAPSEIAELETQYLELIAPQVFERLQVQFAGKRATPLNTSSELIYLHHLQFQCRAEYVWAPETAPTQFQLVDRNFPEMPGHYRLALRGRGKVAVQTAQAPLIVRAERTAIEGQRPGQQDAPTIEGLLLSTAAPRTADIQAESSPPQEASPPQPGTALPAARRQPENDPATAPSTPREPPVPTALVLPTWLTIALVALVLLLTLPFLLASQRARR